MLGNSSVWDEFQWEAHLRRLDRVADRIMEVRYYHPPYPFATRAPWTITEISPPFDTDEIADDEYGLMSFPGRILRAAGECAPRAFQLAPACAVRSREASLVVEFLANVSAMVALVARAARAEEEREELGKGIALAKRSLAAANRALGALGDLRARYRGDELFELADELTELRNEIAFYVIDLREQFRSCAGAL